GAARGEKSVEKTQAERAERAAEQTVDPRERQADTAKKEKNTVRQLLESLNWRNAQTYFLLGKILLFVFLLVIESFILIPQIVLAKRTHSYFGLILVCVSVAVLTGAETVKLVALKKFRAKLWCYVLDFTAAFCLTAVTGSRYLSTLYMIILTDYYISAEKLTASLLGCFVSLGVYVVTMWVSGLIRQTDGAGLWVFAQSFNDLVILMVHFIAVTFAVRFYRQSVKLSETLRQLDESNKQLEKAYADLAEVTALEERQRIAKDIHDTAGHSITTVIMQTEAAKLVIEKNPAEAKSRIVAANLQAKHALEELRESVHLLSGAKENDTLKEALTAIIHESSDGTGIVVRSDVDDITVSPAKYRFLCNSLKEGISNGLRHGGATAFYFELKQEGRTLKFLLADNGCGVQEPLKKGFGLTGMEARAQSLGGSVDYSFEADGGFEIEIALPADAPPEEREEKTDVKRGEKSDGE
ncbi:MAG: sensor histidine kinase, partial [Candidatus Scatosoma sp.]